LSSITKCRTEYLHSSFYLLVHSGWIRQWSSTS